MGKIIEWLSGRKTYIVAVAAVLTALGAYLSGTITLPDFIKAVFAAMGAITLRAGISKSGPTPPAV